MEYYNFFKAFLDTFKQENPELIKNPKWAALVDEAFKAKNEIELDILKMEMEYNSNEQK